jgi:hypothetical protein
MSTTSNRKARDAARKREARRLRQSETDVAHLHYLAALSQRSSTANMYPERTLSRATPPAEPPQRTGAPMLDWRDDPRHRVEVAVSRARVIR